MAAIESAAGIMNVKEIALASKRLMGIALGAEDYVTNLKTSRSKTWLGTILCKRSDSSCC